MKIIVRMPNWIGDLVMATPLLTDLRRAFPEAEICAMCTAKLAPLLEHDPDINELFAFSRPSGWIKKEEGRDVVGTIRAGRYDLGILTTNSLSSAWWFWRGGVKRRLGFKTDGRWLFLNEGLPLPKTIEEQHLVLTYKALLEPLGISPSATKPRLYLQPDEIEAARALLAKRGVPPGAKIVGVNPGAAYGSAKCWLPERFREVIERLLEDPNLYVLCFGDSSGAPLVKQICSGLPNRVINLAGGTTLRELVALISLCDVVLTNDSGPMHIAAAMKRPLVAIFGSTSDLKTGPYGEATVIHKHVFCSPCYLKECPIDLRCMSRITASEVYSALLAKLSSAAPR
ncbi:MAG: lipopolysaccharide heptosyltransferase II [Parachlamydiales bacterium]